MSFSSLFCLHFPLALPLVPMAAQHYFVLHLLCIKLNASMNILNWILIECSLLHTLSPELIAQTVWKLVTCLQSLIQYLLHFCQFFNSPKDLAYASHIWLSQGSDLILAIIHFELWYWKLEFFQSLNDKEVEMLSNKFYLRIWYSNTLKNSIQLRVKWIQIFADLR